MKSIVEIECKSALSVSRVGAESPFADVKAGEAAIIVTVVRDGHSIEFSTRGLPAFVITEDDVLPKALEAIGTQMVIQIGEANAKIEAAIDASRGSAE